ncbi:MAG TPA: Tex family protein [Candidatus Eisenbacteria bacterium]|nr:Tex family protein [Candidatus Eisenbacteria bacterium]
MSAETPGSRPDIERILATELSVTSRQVWAAIRLLDGGATVPFIARYRKEATGGLSDTHLRMLAERLDYLRELEDRRRAVLENIEAQGKLTPALKEAIEAARTPSALEDLFLPFRQKKQSKAQTAREAGLAPLAERLLADPERAPEEAAAPFVDPMKNVADAGAALAGAREILIERFAEDAALIGTLRERFWNTGWIVSKAPGKEEAAAKFSDYFNFREPLREIPSHRALALFRGRQEDFLRVSLETDGFAEYAGVKDEVGHEYVAAVCERFGIRSRRRPGDAWLSETARQAWRYKIRLHLELDLMARLRRRAEDEAIRVFAENLKNLLLAAPAGPRVTLGLDPGFRTGVKAAVVDATGKVLDTATVYPHAPEDDWRGALSKLSALMRLHKVTLVAIGNGTASRETDALAAELLKANPDLGAQKAVVSEAGASVYSASALASAELPSLDVTLRGAVSIARRLQDPLAELVKIDPKAIGVGQYQHDVNQTRLEKSLGGVIEDCVNAVGVDLNTASPSLLARVAGLGRREAEDLVFRRDRQGAFKNRLELKGALGARAFEQAAGFLRISGGDNPLDRSGVHPEAYPVVERILAKNNVTLDQALGNARLLASLRAEDYVDETFGVPTVEDILDELEKPGRDPRPEFRTAVFKEGVKGIGDLKPGMMLEGTVTNVAAFGAFVDIGVHQDGLVHVSELADLFVRDPHSVVKTGQVVRVKVLEIDLPRNRIALSMRQKSGARR